MKTAILYVLLITGEAGDVGIDAHVCRQVAADVKAGLPVTVDLIDGRQVEVAAAACFDLEPAADLCELEAGA